MAHSDNLSQLTKDTHMCTSSLLSTHFTASEDKATFKVLERQQWPTLTFGFHQPGPHRSIAIGRLQNQEQDGLCYVSVAFLAGDAYWAGRG
jgi:hypothetical protein